MPLLDLNDLSTQPDHWWTARDASYYTINGSNEVGAIANKGTSGSAADAVQATTNLKPLLAVNSNFGPGKPAFRVNDTVDGQRMAMGAALDTGILNRSMCAGSMIDWRVRLSGVNVDAFDGAFDNATPSLVYAEWDTTSTRFYENGVLVDTQAGAATPGCMVQLIALNSAGGTGGGGGGVGAGFGAVFYNEGGAATLFNANAGNRPLDGDVSDAAYYSAVPGTTLRQEIEGVLCWAVGIALPSGHPYGLAAPSTDPPTYPVAGAITGSASAAGLIGATRPVNGAIDGSASASGAIGLVGFVPGDEIYAYPLGGRTATASSIGSRTVTAEPIG